LAIVRVRARPSGRRSRNRRSRPSRGRPSRRPGRPRGRASPSPGAGAPAAPPRLPRLVLKMRMKTPAAGMNHPHLESQPPRRAIGATRASSSWPTSSAGSRPAAPSNGGTWIDPSPAPTLPCVVQLHQLQVHGVAHGAPAVAAADVLLQERGGVQPQAGARLAEAHPQREGDPQAQRGRVPCHGE